MYRATIYAGIWAGDQITRPIRVVFSDGREAWIKSPLTSQIPWVIDHLHCNNIVQCAEEIITLLNAGYIAVVFSTPRLDGWGQILTIYSKMAFRAEIEDVVIVGDRVRRETDTIVSKRINNIDSMSRWTLIKHIRKMREEATYIGVN